MPPTGHCTPLPTKSFFLKHFKALSVAHRPFGGLYCGKPSEIEEGLVWRTSCWQQAHLAASLNN